MASSPDSLDNASPLQFLAHHAKSTIDSVGEKLEKGTLIGVTLNTLCNVMGAGVLSMSFAMYNASIGFGLMFLVYSAMCSAIASFILAKGCHQLKVFTMKELLAHAVYPPPPTGGPASRTGVNKQESGCTQDVVTSRMSASHILGEQQFTHESADRVRMRNRVTLAVNIIIFLYNYGTLIVYSRVIADSIPPVVEDFLHGSGFWAKDYTWLGAAGAIFFPLSCARHMEALKWTSLLGFITIFYIVVIVVVKANTQNAGDVAAQTNETTDVSYFHFTMATFKSITTYGLAFCYHYNVPYYYKELKGHTPKKFMVSVAVCLPLITLCYGLVGVYGYLTFGAAVGDAAAGGNIVNNYSTDDLLVNIGRLGLFFHFVSVYPILSVSARRGLHALLQEFVFSRCSRATEETTLLEADNHFSTDTAKDPTTIQLLSEAFFLVSTTIVIAYFVPGVGIVIEISGCLFGIFLMFFVPGTIGLRIFGGSFVEDDDQNHFYSRREERSWWWFMALFQLATGTIFIVTASCSLIYGFATGSGRR